MGTFKVGDRVRCVKAYFNPQDVGKEFVVVNRGPDLFTKFASSPREATYWLDDDTWVYAHQIEPIQPERNQVIAWSECLWQPERETA